MISEALNTKIGDKAISLEAYGYNDLVWNYQDAIDLLHSLEGEPIAVLGGSLCEVQEDKVSWRSEGWYCDPNEDESREEYFSRSHLEALKYIENFPEPQKYALFYSMTFNEIIDLDQLTRNRIAKIHLTPSQCKTVKLAISLIDSYLSTQQPGLEILITQLSTYIDACQFTNDILLECSWEYWGRLEEKWRTGKTATAELRDMRKFLASLELNVEKPESK